MKFTSILKKVILEHQTRFEVLLDNLTKPRKNKDGEKIKPILSKEEFFNLVQGDPTSRMNNVTIDDVQNYSKIKAGSYVEWIIKKYLNPETESSPDSDYYRTEVKIMKDRFFEDLYRLTTNLTKFDRFKNSIPENFRNINTLDVYKLDDLVRKFSLEKTKASKKEKEIAKSTYEHPGGNVDFRGSDWTIIKITDSSKLGQDAACFYGGYHLSSEKGESNWCTSGPGLTFFEGYIKNGPLYVIFPQNDNGQVGQRTGLPQERYQFHFPSNQFMDREDHGVDLVKFLSQKAPEIKELFKPEFMKGLIKPGTGKLVIDYPSSSTGKFVALYGFDELFDAIPETVTSLKITNSSRETIDFVVPDTISKFKNLESLVFDNFIKSLPESISQLSRLSILSLPNTASFLSVSSLTFQAEL